MSRSTLTGMLLGCGLMLLGCGLMLLSSRPARSAPLSAAPPAASAAATGAPRPATEPRISLQGYRRGTELRFDNARVNPAWLWLLLEARRRGWTGNVKGSISGLRTYDEQAYLHRLFVDGEGAPAFNPDGPSRHLIRNVGQLGEWAQAVDVTRPQGLVRAAAQVGVQLHVPYAHEPWHVEARLPFAAPLRFAEQLRAQTD